MNSLYETLYTHIRSLRKGKLLDGEEEEGHEEEEEAEKADYNDEEDDEIEYDPDVVIEVLTKFMEKKNGLDQSESGSPKKTSLKTIERERKLIDLNEERLAWEKATHVLPDHTFRIWGVRNLFCFYLNCIRSLINHSQSTTICS
jgi:hypothetical protein